MLKKVILTIVFLLMLTSVYADTVTFEWDPPSNIAGITNYVLFGSQSITTVPATELIRVPVGTNKATVQISSGTYVYAISIGDNGLQSVKSNVVQYIIIQVPGRLRVATIVISNTISQKK